MTALEAIRARRTVRSYLPDPVPSELLRDVIDAARWAPTSGNAQPWEFVRVVTPAIREQLVASTYGGFARTAPAQAWLGEAPELLVACVNSLRTAARYGEEGHDWAKIDVAAAIENLLIAATSLGLGAAWIGGFRPDEVKRALRLDRDLHPLGMIALGYARETPAKPYRLPVDDILTEV